VALPERISTSRLAASWIANSVTDEMRYWRLS
jgi:hypothetical protein